ncbi:MAG: hypothetical protein IKG56_03100 [Clostridia bacterium]|nr:hypothetical protein [Clostridia bacterium]
MKNKKLKISKIIITISIIFTSIIIAFYTSLIVNIISKKIKDKKAVNRATEIVLDYMNKKYNKEFSAKLTSKGYAEKYVPIPPTGEIYCGHDRNIMNYDFELKCNESNVISYATVSQNISEGNASVNEGNTSYELAQRLAEINEKVSRIVKKYYDVYNSKSDLSTENYNNDKIKVNIESNYKKELNQNLELISDIIELLKEKDVDTIVELNYKGIILEVGKDGNVDSGKRYFEFVEKVENCMKNNYEEPYIIYTKMSPPNPDINVKLDVKIKKEYNSERRKIYSKLYSELKKIVDETKMSIQLEFKDNDAFIGTYSDDTFEEYYKDFIANYD